MSSPSKGIRDRDPVHLLDPAKVRALRVRSGIAETALGAALGVATNVIRNLEHGSDQRYFNLAFVRDLARALGVHPSELIRQPDDEIGTDVVADPDRCTPGDVREVGAVLATCRSVVRVDALADALGWTIARTLLALDSLGTQLPTFGQRLQWLHDVYVSIAPDGDHFDTVEQVERRGVAEMGFNRDELRLLVRLANIGPNNRFSELPRFPLIRLIAAGYVEVGVLPDDERDPKDRKAEGARLTGRARFDLVLDQS